MTTHSPVVLDSVPPEGRIFLERDAATLDVTRTPACRDIFQKALYGQSTDRLSILCEDEVAEGVILGVLDVLNYRNGTRHDDFVVGRDTGSDEFRGHIHAFGKFGKLAGFVFVLDGISIQEFARSGKLPSIWGQSWTLLSTVASASVCLPLRGVAGLVGGLARRPVAL